MRRTLSVVSAIVALALVSTAVAAPARAAAADRTYHGVFVEAMFPDGTCAGTVLTELPAGGNWNVTLQSDGTAVVHVTVFAFDKLLTAWGGNDVHPLARSVHLDTHQFDATFTQLTPAAGEVFSLAMPIAAIGSNLAVVLTTDHQVTFTFTPYFGCEWHRVIGLEQ